MRRYLLGVWRCYKTDGSQKTSQAASVCQNDPLFYFFPVKRHFRDADITDMHICGDDSSSSRESSWRGKCSQSKSLLGQVLWVFFEWCNLDRYRDKILPEWNKIICWIKRMEIKQCIALGIFYWKIVIKFIFCWATMYGYKENQLSNILASKYEWKYAGKSTKLIF